MDHSALIIYAEKLHPHSTLCLIKPPGFMGSDTSDCKHETQSRSTTKTLFMFNANRIYVELGSQVLFCFFLTLQFPAIKTSSYILMLVHLDVLHRNSCHYCHAQLWLFIEPVYLFPSYLTSICIWVSHSIIHNSCNKTGFTRI